MPVSERDRQVVDGVFRAMHERAAGENAMMALFAEDSQVIEPFSGQPQTHRGKPAIRAWFREAVNQMAPDMALKLDRLDMDGGRVRAEWTCTSVVMKGPMRGYDLYTIEAGLIKAAEFVVTEMPEFIQG